jgi:hypothetical protein
MFCLNLLQLLKGMAFASNILWICGRMNVTESGIIQVVVKIYVETLIVFLFVATSLETQNKVQLHSRYHQWVSHSQS